MDLIINHDGSLSLCHHGVKGMRWGIRRYQNKDGSLTPAGINRYQRSQNKQANKGKTRADFIKERTIPAGTKMYRVSTNSDESLQGSTYVSYLDVDRNHYKGGYVRIRDKSNTAYEHQYTLKKDLNLPSREKQQEAINKIVKNNSDYLYESVKAWVDIAYPEGSWSRYILEDHYDGNMSKYVDGVMKKWGDKTPEELAYSVCQSMGLAPNVKKEIISELQNQGYNAMVDEASVGGQNGWVREGYDTLIVFDSSILGKNDVKTISRSEEEKARQDDINWRTKANSRKDYGQWSDL